MASFAPLSARFALGSLLFGFGGVAIAIASACSSDPEVNNKFNPNEAGSSGGGGGDGGAGGDGEAPDDLTPREPNTLSKGAPCALRENKEVVCWGYGFGPRPQTVQGVQNITYVNGRYGRTNLGEIVQWFETQDGSTPKLYLSLDPILDLAVNSRAFIARSVVQKSIRVIREGTSTCGSLAVPGEGVSVATILPWPELNGVKRLYLGDGHGCAIRKDDAVVCWGKNTKGQLGHAPNTEGDQASGADVCNPTVVPVGGAGGTPFKAKDVAIGSTSTCAIGLDDEKVYCWGDNKDGALGRGSLLPEFDPAPRLIAGVDDAVTDLAGRVQGDLNTYCTATNGIVYCWGNNNAAQLGVVGASSTAPTQILNLGGVEELSIAGPAVFARDGEGTIKAWGGNDEEMLGHAKGTDGDIPNDGGAPTFVNPTPSIVIDGN